MFVGSTTGAKDISFQVEKASFHYLKDLGMMYFPSQHTHKIHRSGIFTYIWLIFLVNIPMDPMG